MRIISGKYKGKKILTYCTGGIKCEKASALLLKEGFEDVYQLHGGIIKYGKEAGGKDFEGKCYVFDNRVTVDVNSVNPEVISTCKNCGKTTSKMINCANPDCNEHFTQCDDCGTELSGCCSTSCMAASNSAPRCPGARACGRRCGCCRRTMPMAPGRPAARST